jgi:hypothetical protein
MVLEIVKVMRNKRIIVDADGYRSLYWERMLLLEKESQFH